MRTIISALAAFMVAAIVVAHVATPVSAQGTLGPQGDITAVNTPAGGGLEGGVTKGAAYLTLTTLCGVSQVLKWDGSTWACSADATGVGGSGTTNRVAKWTGPGTLGDSSIFDDGAVVAISRADGGVVNDKPIVSINNTTTTGGINHRALLRFLAADSGDVLRTSTIEAEGGNLFFTSANTLRFQSAANFASTLNSVGAITENSDRVISLAGAGLLKTGRTLSIDDTYVQRRVSGSCPAGSSIREIAADGSVTCEADDGTAKITTVSGGTGTANDVDCGAGTTLCRLSYGTVTVTGFVAGVDGQVMDVVYTGTTSLTVTHQGATSTAGNRMILPGAQSWTFASGGGLRLYYDGASSRWRAIGPTDRLPSATIAGAATVGTTLDVTGEVTLSGQLVANSKADLNGRVTFGAHVISAGAPPVASSCGASPSPVVVGTDTAFTITAGGGGGGPTGCTITFDEAYASAPTCTVSPRASPPLGGYSISASAITFSGAVEGATYDVICVGH